MIGVRVVSLAAVAAISAVTVAACSREDPYQVVLDEIRETVGAPGAILGLEFSGGTSVLVASGVADLNANRPVAPDDAFFLGSVSKVYTAVVALRLAEEGRLSLEDPVSAHIDGLRLARDVTVRQLLTHTSGLRDFYSYLYFRPDREEMIELVTKEWTREELLALVARFGFSFEPGADWSYSNTNYFLLGAVIEGVTGRTLAEGYRRYVYEPLGLTNTWLTRHEAAPDSLSITGYMGPVAAWEHSEMFGELGPTTALDYSPVEWGAGGLAASAAEALDFLSALMRGRLLSPESLAAMQDFRPTPPLGAVEDEAADAGRPDGYGYGLVRMERPGATLLGHGGLFTGHTTGLWYIPACGATVVFYFNRGFVGQRRALDDLLTALSDTPGSPCPTEGPAAQPAGVGVAGQVTGRMRLPW